jgi:integrase
MSHSIHLARVRNELKPRREPYWAAPIGSGKYIGLRKAANGSCTWVARIRDDELKQKYKALGQVTDELTYDKAKKAAADWFKQIDAGVESDDDDVVETVDDACRKYVKTLQADGREKTAADAEQRFKANVYGTRLGRTKLAKIRTDLIRGWRNGLGGGRGTQNRNLSNLKAALNLAVGNRNVMAEKAQQWRAVKPHENADGRREVYLDLEQRRALVAACSGALRDLVQAAALTGMRPGELREAKRGQFDARTSTFHLRDGKTGPRNVRLTPAAVEVFKRAGRDKLPTANLFTRDDGTPWIRSGRQGWVQLFKAAVRDAGLPDDTVLYSLRHSFITDAILRGGETTFEVSVRTGTSLTMIQKHYGHLCPESTRDKLADVEML